MIQLLLLLLGAPCDRVVGVVGDSVVLHSQVQLGVELLKLTTRIQAPDSLLYEEVLDQLLNSQLLLTAAVEETVVVEASEVEAALSSSIEAVKGRFPSEASFDSALAAEGLTREGLKERYREEIHRQLILRRLFEKKGLTEIYIPPSEVRRFYEAHRDSLARDPGWVRLAHILFAIRPSRVREEAAQRRIGEVYKILLGGGEFDVVAESFSEDPKTRDRGGWLGEFRHGELVEEVDRVAFSLSPGEFSPPFRSRFGYQILKCEAREGDRVSLRHILIPVLPSRADTLATRALADSVRKMLLAGEDLAALVKRYSDDPGSRERGGELGVFKLDELPPLFDPVVSNLNPGGVSQPILSEFGFHLVVVLERRDPRIIPYEELKEEVRSWIYEQRLAERVEGLVAELRERVYVERIR